MRYALASIALASLLTLAPQQGMIPVVDTKSTGSTPLNPCLISGWPINEGSGRTLHDVSGNANNATTVTVTPTWGSNAGFPGSSMSFNPVGGNNAGASSTTLTNFTGATPFSLAAWLNITASHLDEIILSDRSSGGSDTGWELTSRTLGNTTTEFLLIGSGGDSLQVHGSTTIVATGLHYLVVTYDGSKTPAGIKIYVDGVADTVTMVTNTLTTSTASGLGAGIGFRPADQNGMTGVMAGVAIYNCVLTPTQVSTYNGRGVQVN